MISQITNWTLMVFLVILALAILRTRHLFAMAMMFSLYSLMVAGLFMVLDAPDVAFTEAAVGTGISTVLMLATLAATKVGRESPHTRRTHAGAFLITVFTGALLIYGTHELTPQGDPNAPVHTEVARRYIDKGQQETGVPNLVTAVLASYRGYDTLGEVTVVLTAGISVLLLLRRERKPRVKGAPADGEEH